jgi:hypothetical protein
MQLLLLLTAACTAAEPAAAAMWAKVEPEQRGPAQRIKTRLSMALSKFISWLRNQRCRGQQQVSSNTLAAAELLL